MFYIFILKIQLTYNIMYNNIYKYLEKKIIQFIKKKNNKS